MMRTHAGWAVVFAIALAPSCKTEEQKRREEAEKQIKASAAEMAKAAQALGQQGAALGQQGANLGQQGAALGQQGAALGQQGAALGAQGAAAGMAAAAEAMKALAGGAGAGGAKYETVDFRELKGLLPETIGGLKRTSASGEKNAMMGFAMSLAKGSYKAESGEGRLSVKLM